MTFNDFHAYRIRCDDAVSSSATYGSVTTPVSTKGHLLKSWSTNKGSNAANGCEQRGLDVSTYASEGKSTIHGQTISRFNGVHEHCAYSIDRYVRDIDPREKVRLGMFNGAANSSSTQCNGFKGSVNQK